MNKPDWFKLTDSDEPDPINLDYRPIGVISFILAIAIVGVFFLFPENSPVEPKPSVEIIQTPVLPELTEDITPV